MAPPTEYQALKRLGFRLMVGTTSMAPVEWVTSTILESPKVFTNASNPALASSKERRKSQVKEVQLIPVSEVEELTFFANLSQPA